MDGQDEAAVLADLEAMVRAGTLVGRGGDLLAAGHGLVAEFLNTGTFGVADDPFGGADASLLADDMTL